MLVAIEVELARVRPCCPARSSRERRFTVWLSARQRVRPYGLSQCRTERISVRVSTLPRDASGGGRAGLAGSPVDGEDVAADLLARLEAASAALSTQALVELRRFVMHRSITSLARPQAGHRLI
jgi:hypothetical protein